MIAVLLTVITGLAVGPAFAHAGLVATTPADGATLTTPPAQVVFTFDEDLLPDAATISINDEQGNVVATQKVVPTGDSVTVPWPASLAPATYQVAYRVASTDGHPVAGAISFTFAEPADAVQPTQVPSTSSAVPTIAPSDKTTTQPAAGLAPSTLIGIGIVLLIGGIAVGFALRRRD
jgi:methionine-rich copper-binding protein CopC